MLKLENVSKAGLNMNIWLRFALKPKFMDKNKVSVWSPNFMLKLWYYSWDSKTERKTKVHNKNQFQIDRFILAKYNLQTNIYVGIDNVPSTKDDTKRLYFH